MINLIAPACLFSSMEPELSVKSLAFDQKFKSSNSAEIYRGYSNVFVEYGFRFIV